MQTTEHKAQTTSLREYVAHRASSGIQFITGGPGTFWTRDSRVLLVRQPNFHTEPPASGEVREVLWRGRTLCATYLLEPDEHHPANAWHYVCTDHAYALEQLPPEDMGRNVRRGLKKLRIAWLTSQELLAHGAQAYCDTMRRLGRGSSGIAEGFRRHYTDLAQYPEYVYLGAWKDNQLAAFFCLIEVDDWVSINESYAMDSLLRCKPNETLMYSTLSHYLVERKCRLVSAGTSWIPVEPNSAGLHRFKTKVGFEARPVHRVYVPHPLLRPFANRLTLWGVNTALRLRPEDHRLKRARGLLACMLGDTSTLEATVRGTIEK
jgi:hypothetical protein